MHKIEFIYSDFVLQGEVRSSQKTGKELIEILQHMVRKLDAAKELAYAARSCEEIEVRVALGKYNEAVK